MVQLLVVLCGALIYTEPGECIFTNTTSPISISHSSELQYLNSSSLLSRPSSNSSALSQGSLSSTFLSSTNYSQFHSSHYSEQAKTLDAHAPLPSNVSTSARKLSITALGTNGTLDPARPFGTGSVHNQSLPLSRSLLSTSVTQVITNTTLSWIKNATETLASSTRLPALLASASNATPPSIRPTLSGKLPETIQRSNLSHKDTPMPNGQNLTSSKPSTLSNTTNEQNLCPQATNWQWTYTTTPPRQGTGRSYAKLCNTMQIAWDTASRSWSNSIWSAHQINIGPPTTSLSTSQIKVWEGTGSEPTATLCDRFPRAPGSWTPISPKYSTTTLTVTTQASRHTIDPDCRERYGNTSLTFAPAKPTCSIDSEGCEYLWSRYLAKYPSWSLPLGDYGAEWGTGTPRCV